MTALLLLAVLAQQYPPESAPIQPAIPVPVLFMVLDVPPPALDLPAAPPGEPIRQLMLCPNNVFTDQAACATYAQSGQTAANNVYAADPANLTRVVIIPVFLATYATPNQTSTELGQMFQNQLPGVDVWKLRQDNYADRVSLVNHDGNTCGQAYINAATYGKGYAYSVINKDCGISNSSLWHEWGHNDGLCHDTPNATGCNPAKPYGYGYCDPLGNNQSPMTYPQPCNKPRRIFSNKDNTWTYGHVYGDATHDEAAVQRWAMPIEANFLPPPPSHRPRAITNLSVTQ